LLFASKIQHTHKLRQQPSLFVLANHNMEHGFSAKYPYFPERFELRPNKHMSVSCDLMRDID
jgi:hypothetical protein